MKYSLATTLIAFFMLSIILLAVVKPSLYLVSVLFFLTYIWLAASLVLTLSRTKRQACFWRGVSVFGVAYIFMLGREDYSYIGFPQLVVQYCTQGTPLIVEQLYNGAGNYQAEYFGLLAEVCFIWLASVIGGVFSSFIQRIDESRDSTAEDGP